MNDTNLSDDNDLGLTPEVVKKAINAGHEMALKCRMMGETSVSMWDVHPITMLAALQAVWPIDKGKNQ